MKSAAKADPNLGKTDKTTDNEYDSEENQENITPDEKNASLLAHQLSRSAKKPRTSKLDIKHPVIESQRVKRHSMITRWDTLKNTPTLNLRSRTIIKSEYKYEDVKSGSQVLKARNLFASGAFESSPESDNTTNIIDKETRSENDSKPFQNDQNRNTNIPSSSIKESVKSPKTNVLNSLDGVQVVEINKVGHDGISVSEKKLHTVSKPFRLSSCSCAVKSQNKPNEESIKAQWTFKARSTDVPKKIPLVSKFEKKCTKPRNVYLNTERRAEEWKVIEKKKFERQETLRREQEAKKIKEMYMIKKMRQKMVHKAEPIKKYKPILIRKSEKPVTVAKSPKLSKRRTRNYITVNENN